MLHFTSNSRFDEFFEHLHNNFLQSDGGLFNLRIGLIEDCSKNNNIRANISHMFDVKRSLLDDKFRQGIEEPTWY